MSLNPLGKILAPKSVAIAGASNNPMKMGTLQALNIIHGEFPGEVLFIHPKEKNVFGHPAYAFIEDLPIIPDLAMLVVPTRLVVPMMEKFGELGTRHAIIISAGFKETGEEGIALEKKLVEVAEQYDMRFLGPNCMGVFNTALPFNATVTPLPDKPGGLSLASQSGTYIAQTLGYARDRGVRLQKAVSIGNEASIDIVDCLEYLGEDPETSAIGLYIESLRRPERFLEVARAVSRKKPIIAQYVGGTRAGARSGASHTGAMAGPDYVYDGLFAQAGIIRASSIEEVYRAGNALASAPPLKGSRIAVLTHSGGPGTAMSDTCDREGLSVEELPESVQERIRPLIPPHASSKNPVDLTFVTNMEPMTRDIPKILMESDAVDGILLHGLFDTGWAHMAYPVLGKVLNVSLEEILPHFHLNIDELCAMPEKYGKPLLTSSFMGREDQALLTLQDRNIPTFDSPEKAARAMGCLFRHLAVRTRPEDRAEPAPIPEAAREILSGAKSMDEHEAKRLLAAYGVPVCGEKRVSGVEAAHAAAKEIGFPVALKAASADISHKTEKGLVHLNLTDADSVARACEKIAKAAPDADFLVCEMVAGDREFIAGISRLESFPPLVLFGLGGVAAEALADFSVRLCPVGGEEAGRLVRSLKSSKLLGPWRGQPAVDAEALAGILVSLSRLALDFPRVREMDLNPILIRDGKPVVVDALAVIGEE